MWKVFSSITNDIKAAVMEDLDNTNIEENEKEEIIEDNSENNNDVIEKYLFL